MYTIYKNQVRYSRSYAKAAREGKPIIFTSNVRWYVWSEFDKFYREFLETIELEQDEE